MPLASRFPALRLAAFALMGLMPFAVSGCVSDSGALLSEAAQSQMQLAAAPIPSAAPRESATSESAEISSEKALALTTVAESGTVSGSAAIDQMIVRHAEENGIPPELAFAVVKVESRYNPHARGAGVYGLSQIKPATARSLGFAGSASDLLDPDTNLTYGMKYLKGAWEKGGHDVCQTAMKYKGGHRATRMTRSASAYCSKVKQHMAALAERRRAPALAVPATTRETAEAPASRPATDAPASRAADAATERGRQNGVPRPKPAPAADQASAAPATTEAGDAKLADATETPKAATETVQRTDTASAKGGRLRPEGNGRSS
ncbi:Soluble lytic murein transglycosylase [Fulvimarina manganoxydans]|uniref:Soluble lytic murein transglycosylase n=1 Tax=Fulvimarina manganoxydans TaxID=937218 RepID=A0A1W2AV94_9HYPH|nr:lytic transglycosylase domain-containing protein [Fulvimarina manganoxydans]SMC64412.1 Soluble lytic murein transglycosylase [Fulvimarina manganoxydans]